MKEERANQVIKILPKDETNHSYEFDPVSKKQNGFYSRNLDSTQVEYLEKLGFKVIYPAQLTEKEISNMNSKEMLEYDNKKKRALVIDGQEEYLSLDFATMITKHYLSAGTPTHVWRCQF